MKLSPDQEIAHDVVLARLRRGERLTKLSGYAGTGKTTLGLTFVERHRSEFTLQGAAPTGKAAARQQEVTGMRSTTIHRVFWKGAVGVSKDGDLLFGEVDKKHMCEQLKERKGKRRVLWIDEGSMVDLSLARKIMKAVPDDVSIVVSGDPFQLQPVNGQPGFDLPHPDAMLTEVHRQALGSPVIRLATWVRTERKIPTAQDFKRFGIPYFCAPLPVICEAVARRRGEDAAVVVHTHLARRLVNRGVRHYLGLPPREAGPAQDELLLIRRNNTRLGVFNGTTARVTHSNKYVNELLQRAYFHVQLEGVDGVGWLPEQAWIDDEKMSYEESGAVFDELKECVSPMAAMSILEASPGYAGTCHAFQGSQFDRVFLLDEGNRDIHWWYTGITRAIETLVVGKIKGWNKIRRGAAERAQKASPQGLL